MSQQVCGIFAIPPICDASTIISSAVVVSGGSICTDPPTYRDTKTVSGIVYSGGEMAIGKLRAVLPSYDPSNAQLAVYGFTVADVTNQWIPTVYTMSGGSMGVVTSGGIIPSGGNVYNVCASNGYNTTNDQYTLVSWYTAATLRDTE